FVKAGPGQLNFSGDGSGQFGGLTLNGGTLALDYSTNTASKLGAGALTLNGGTLFLFANSSTPVTQTILGNTAVAAGHTDVSGLFNGTVTLGLGTITPTAGATIDVSSFNGTNFTATTSTGVSPGGLLGSGPAFATFGGGATWATKSGSAIVGLSIYGTDVYSTNTNTDVTTSAAFANITTNSLRFNTNNPALTLSGTNTLQSGGILVTPNASGGTITGGTLTAPSS